MNRRRNNQTTVVGVVISISITIAFLFVASTAYISLKEWHARNLAAEAIGLIESDSSSLVEAGEKALDAYKIFPDD